MEKEEIIKDLERQIEDIKGEDMNEASWGMEEGVLISGREAKIIIKLLKNKDN